MQIRCNFPDISYLSETQKNNFQFLKQLTKWDGLCTFIGFKQSVECFVWDGRNGMGCFVRGGKNGMGSFVRVTKTAWDVLSGVANWCGMFCPGC